MEVKSNVKMIRGRVELNTSIQTCRPQLQPCGGVAFLIEIFNIQHKELKYSIFNIKRPKKKVKPLPEVQRKLSNFF